MANIFSDSGLYSGYGSWGTFQYVDERLTASSKWNGTKDYLLEQNLPIPTSNYGLC